MNFALNLKEGYSPMKLPKQKSVEIDVKTTDDLKGLLKATAPIFAISTTKAASLTMPLLLSPTIAFADTFGDIHETVMTLFDGGVVLIIIFAGAAWSLGHRSKAIELLIGVCCGYLLARHAVDIRDYLKGIGGN